MSAIMLCIYERDFMTYWKPLPQCFNSLWLYAIKWPLDTRD